MVSQALAGRQLNSRDRRLRDDFQRESDRLDDPRFKQEAMAQDLTPENIEALGRELDRAKDPRQRQILLEELARLKDLASNLLGPVAPPTMLPGSVPQGAMQMPYNPQTQAAGIFGGQRMNSQPTPGSM